MERKKLLLGPDKIEELVEPMGECLATDHITVDGMKIGFMYRDEPEDNDDSGWRFLSGTEDQGYMNNPGNAGWYDVNTIANYDKAIIPYLEASVGTEFERIEGTDEFRQMGTSAGSVRS
jgi:hypothetical protein